MLGLAMDAPRERSVIARGVMLALLAALAFGLTTPLVQRAGALAGPFATAFLLYAGAALGTAPWLRRSPAAPLVRGDLGRIVGIGLLGAAIAPTLFAWGLRRSAPAGASILTNTEAIFTALLARLLFREHLGRRVLFALSLMLAGGVVIVGASASGAASGSALGLAVLVAGMFAWALDNALARPLADRDPGWVVAAKAAVGATATATLALASGDVWPSAGCALVLLACGATGYGLSLRLYLLAQRRIGAARTASVFALAPFVGAVLAWALGDRAGTASIAAGAALFGLGTWLHLTERHRHPHVHDATAHAHAHPHRHDDGHHDHSHDVYPAGEHSHSHVHARLEHAHEHGEDLHHRHTHS